MMPTRGSRIADEHPFQPFLVLADGPDARESAHERLRPGKGDLQVVVGETDQPSRPALSTLEHEQGQLLADLVTAEGRLLGGAEAPEPGGALPDHSGRDPSRCSARGLGPPAVR